jgi:hypothetical protein
MPSLLAAIALRIQHAAVPDGFGEFQRTPLRGHKVRRHIWKRKIYDLADAAQRAQFLTHFDKIAADHRYQEPNQPFPLFIDPAEETPLADLAPPTTIEEAVAIFQRLAANDSPEKRAAFIKAVAETLDEAQARAILAAQPAPPIQQPVVTPTSDDLKDLDATPLADEQSDNPPESPLDVPPVESKIPGPEPIESEIVPEVIEPEPEAVTGELPDLPDTPPAPAPAPQPQKRSHKKKTK